MKTVTRELIIDVYDDINPTIELNSSIIEVEYGAVINENSYVVKVHDNIDGDLSKELIIDNAVDTSKAGNYTIKYCVKDNAGNEATAEITVIVKEKPVQEIPVKDNEKITQTAEVLLQKKSGAGKKVSNAGIYNRFFEGYSIDSYNSACDYAEGLKSSGKNFRIWGNPNGDRGSGYLLLGDRDGTYSIFYFIMIQYILLKKVMHPMPADTADI